MMSNDARSLVININLYIDNIRFNKNSPFVGTVYEVLFNLHKFIEFNKLLLPIINLYRTYLFYIL